MVLPWVVCGVGDFGKYEVIGSKRFIGTVFLVEGKLNV